MSPRPSVSVVVPFLGRGAEADRMLENVRRIRLAPGDEAIIADNTPDGIVVAAGEDAIRVVAAPSEQSAFHARNVGGDEANGDWILFMDADCRPAEDLLDAYLESGLDERCGILAGAVLPLEGQAGVIPAYARSRQQLSEAYHVAPRPEWPHPAGITGNLMVRRTAWQAVGGFQEGLLGGADIELCWRIQDAGWGLEHVPAARVEHMHLETLRALIRQTRGHAAGMRWVNRRYPGSFLRPSLARQLARCAVGVPVWALRGQWQRSLFKLIDGRWSLAYARGYLAGDNRAPRRDRPPPSAGPTGVVLLAAEFPTTPPGEAEQEAAAMLEAGRDVRVEALARPLRPDRVLARRLPVTYAEDDPPLARLMATVWLLLRHPIQSLRMRAVGRTSGSRPRLRELAPPARRCARDGGEGKVAAGGQATKASNLNLAQLQAIASGGSGGS